MQVYKVTQTKLDTIMERFQDQGRSFVFTVKTHKALKIKSLDICYTSDISLPQLLLTLKHYWESNTITTLKISPEKQSDTIKLIQAVNKLQQYFLIIELEESIPKYLKIINQNEVESFEVVSTNGSDRSDGHAGEQLQTLKEIMSKYMSFEKGKNNDKAVAEDFSKHFDKISNELYSLSTLHTKSVKFTADLIKYIDTLTFILEQKQASFLHGKIMKWRTFDLLNNYEPSNSQ